MHKEFTIFSCSCKEHNVLNEKGESMKQDKN